MPQQVQLVDVNGNAINSGNPLVPNQRVSSQSGDFADGALATMGLKADTATTDATTTNTQMSFIKGFVKILADVWDSTNHWLQVRLSAATAGGSTPYHLISAASDNATNVKNAAGQIYDLAVSNTAASARYFKLYDKATAPASSDTPKRTLQIPANATLICAYPVGLSFSLGIGFRTTTGLADADTGSVGASDLSIDLGWK